MTDALESLRGPLETHARLKPWGEVSERMLALVEAMTHARETVTRWEDVYMASDANASMSDHYRARKHLDEAASHIAAACRLVIGRNVPGD